MSALASRDVAAAAVAESARRGYLDGQALQGVFTWLRPNDLVWNYVVNNYLLGKEPPAFDILYWNQDTVRVAAGLHRDFIHIGLDNSFTHPDALEVLGQPVNLGRVDLDTYFVAGLTDHIVPWKSAYNGARLFGGERRFVLSSSGHIQALVNPPPAEGGGIPRELPRGRRAARERGGVPGPGAEAIRELVVGLGPLARGALR
jgi:polyhydroxyalkanoate synthase